MPGGMGAGGVVKTFPRRVIVFSSKASVQIRLICVLEYGLVPFATDAIVHNVLVVVDMQCSVDEGSIRDAEIRTGTISTHASHRVPYWRRSQSAWACV